MFNLEDAYTNITLDDIFSKVSEYELWKCYCSNFETLEKPFRSEFYNDNNPDCWLFKADNNKIKYKDFGTGECYSIIEYIQRKYNCNFKECITIMANDFKLAKSKIAINYETKLLNFEENIPRSKVRINILSQPFNFTDFTYWNKYKIPLTLLQEYNIYSCKNVHLIRDNRITTYNYTKQNPIYAYRFNNEETYSYKIYFPYSNDKKYKWLFSGRNSNIEGYDQLPPVDSLLIITKSLKDVLVYRLLGISAISLQGEANIISSNLFTELSTRFETIVCNYDEDKIGKESVEKMYKLYNLKYFFIENSKDISDYIETHTLQETEEMIKRKIEEIDEW